jgi:hypothetical protein
MKLGAGRGGEVRGSTSAADGVDGGLASGGAGGNGEKSSLLSPNLD